MRDRIDAVCRRIQPLGETRLAEARAKQLTLTKPPGSLGRLEEIGNRMAALRKDSSTPTIRKKIYVVAADHGVTVEGVSAYPREVTYQMVFNFLSGGAAINVLGRHCGIDVEVVDAGVDFDFPAIDHLSGKKIVRGSANMARGPALTRSQAEHCIATGIDLALAASNDGIGLLGIGEMGIGNTTAASAITAALTGLDPAKVTGRGTGIDDAGLVHKVKVIRQALEVNQPDPRDPIDILAKVGGAEIGVLAGIALGSASECVPVVADGFISTAAAALAVALQSNVRDYLYIAHKSIEQGHAALIDYIGIEPILDLGMRLGEGTGAALAMHIIEAGSKLLGEMATFGEAGVSDRD